MSCHDSGSRVSEVEERLNSELRQLVKDIWRVGDPAKPQVPFGELFDDDDVQQHYEGLAATLKAAKKHLRLRGSDPNEHFFHPVGLQPFETAPPGGIVTYTSPILLKGAHDKVLIDLVDKSPLVSNEDDLYDLKQSGVDAKLKMEQS
ncbi:hypothetical protein ACHAW5_007759 [Stephanodiscus triporus]|uniref:Costars domain-containing protein n=1 Tax=Stephanodiscus triporus TaxID=2934178 RepID=A0ABD3MSI1_9STRA